MKCSLGISNFLEISRLSHFAYLTSMQSTSREMPGWIKHKLESSLLEEISITLVAQMVKYLLAMRETRVQSLVWEDPLEKELLSSLYNAYPIHPPHPSVEVLATFFMKRSLIFSPHLPTDTYMHSHLTFYCLL